MKSIPGTTTATGTLQFKRRFTEKGLAESAFRALGRTGWQTSVLGFGCYRIDDRTLGHIGALERSIKLGCNLIDTSTNYTDGGSERCVGKALHGLIERGLVAREEIIVVSKVGYVQGENLERAHERERDGKPFPDMVKYTNGCWHCIHPDFIHDQVERTLDRTKLQTIDVYLLHNPEYFFSAIKKNNGQSLEAVRFSFYERIEKAFRFLESLVTAGKISYYGVSSNTFGSPENELEFTSLTQMVAIAERLGKELYGDKSKHHFAVAQMPANLYETGPFLIKNNGADLSLAATEFCQKAGLAVLLNRPLNAFHLSQLIRLANFPTPKEGISVGEAVEKLLGLENDFLKTFASEIQVEPGSIPPEHFFRWGKELSRPEFCDISMEQWNQIREQMIVPQVHYLIGELDSYFTKKQNTQWPVWKTRYLRAVETTLQSVTSECSVRSQKGSTEVNRKISPYLPSEWEKASLSQKALACLINTSGVSAVLNGMRKAEYVDDSLGAIPLEGSPNWRELHQSLHD